MRELKRWLTLVLAILMFAVTGCDRKVAVPPEANPQVGVSIEVELLKPQEKPKPALPEMVFVEGGVFDFHGKQVEVDSFYISKYELVFNTVYLAETWAINEVGIQSEYYYLYSEPIREYRNVPFKTPWYDALYICNVLSMQGGHRPVYYLDQDLTKAIMSSDIEEIPVYIPMGIEEIVEYSLLDFYIDNTADGFRLPTEAEWEYAARGGNKSRGYLYSGSDIAEDVARFYKGPVEVGTRGGNELGLHDMSGNVPEWCIDYWSDEPLVNSAMRDEVYFYEANRLPGFRVTKGSYDNYENTAFRHIDQLDEADVTEYFHPNARLMKDLYYLGLHDNQIGGPDAGPFIRYSRGIDDSGIRLVQKRQK
jgi:hypothetical protein